MMNSHNVCAVLSAKGSATTYKGQVLYYGSVSRWRSCWLSLSRQRIRRRIVDNSTMRTFRVFALKSPLLTCRHHSDSIRDFVHSAPAH